MLTKFDEHSGVVGTDGQGTGSQMSLDQPVSNDPKRRYKEVWIGLGGVHSAVYATETSLSRNTSDLYHRRD